MDDTAASQCVCKADLRAGHITHILYANGKPYLFENVPALICDQCGEYFFRPEVHDLILNTMQQETPTRIDTIAVFDLSEEKKSALSSGDLQSSRLG